MQISAAACQWTTLTPGYCTHESAESQSLIAVLDCSRALLLGAVSFSALTFHWWCVGVQRGGGLLSRVAV